MSDILKKFVCLHPFNYLDVQQNTQWVCCPSWCPTDIRTDAGPVGLSEDLKKNWFSQKAQDIRRSVTDGTYSHCDKSVCPSLSKLINTGQKSINFITVEEFHKRYDLKNFNGLPEEVLFGFDRSCNLKCPSCRATTVPNDDVDSDEYKIKKSILSSIEDNFGPSIKKLMITGSGDPIYSKLYREYLENFDSSKYPNLRYIHLITNGVLLTEKMWNRLNARPYIKSIEVSIDAGTKETYENITRLNGDWDALIENLKFLSTQRTISEFGCSMVVSKHNYKEMKQFHTLITDIFKNAPFRANIYFRKIVHWGTGAYSPDDITELSVFEPGHPDFDKFMIELDKVHGARSVGTHNFYHLYQSPNK